MKKLTNIFLLSVICFNFSSCLPEERTRKEEVSSGGVKKASVKVETGADGLTIEQRNVAERLKRDNDIGSIKHLYVISAYSGQVILYSTVKGKITSSGKRLTSDTTLVKADGGQYSVDLPVPRIQDDGTYGSSVPYVFWFDSKDIYHQHYVSGGQILHVSEQPISVKNIVINMELTDQ